LRLINTIALFSL
jgi:hypothetical protein